MSLRINSETPNFTAQTTQGKINFHEWLGDSWAVLFSHRKALSPVCTTEIGALAKMKAEFERRNTKLIGLSVDTSENYAKWAGDIEETQGTAVSFPMICDTDLQVAKLYDMLPADAPDATIRTLYLIGPDKKIKAMMAYPTTSGRNFNEILRLLDSCQLSAKHSVATPANWSPGEDVIIPPAVNDEQAKQKFPQGWKTVKPYLRIVKLAK